MENGDVFLQLKNSITDVFWGNPGTIPIPQFPEHGHTSKMHGSTGAAKWWESAPGQTENWEEGHKGNWDTHAGFPTQNDDHGLG